MNLRKLTTWQEWVEANKISSIAFLHPFDREKTEQRFKDEAEGKAPRTEDAWGVFDENGMMLSSMLVYHHHQMFDGHATDCGEINMVSSLPEARVGGNIRALIKAIFAELIEQDFVFSTLHPFSFAFYRKFGYEMCYSPLQQEFPVTELSGYTCTYQVKMVETDDDMAVMRKLFEAFIQNKNLGLIRPDRDWTLTQENGRGDGPFGRRNYYRYLFSDNAGVPRGYLVFSYQSSKEHFMVGTLTVNDISYDSPETFKNILGFIYRLRANCVNISVRLPSDIDMSTIVPNCDKVTRSLSTFHMARVLNVKKALELMKHPEGTGSYSIKVTDTFLPANDGVFRVSYADGKAVSVEYVKDGSADLSVGVNVLCQMLIGLIDLSMAVYTPDTELFGNSATLSKVFVKKNVYIGETFFFNP
jgi:predicted acetyltransferase